MNGETNLEPLSACTKIPKKLSASEFSGKDRTVLHVSAESK